MVGFVRIETPFSRIRHRVAQALAYRIAANADVPVPHHLAVHLNDAIAPHFRDLDPADRAHLVAVATWLAARGGSDDLVTAGLLHDIGKAFPGRRVRLADRAAYVLLRAIRPRGLRWVAAFGCPPRIGAGVWVLARHATAGATLVASAGYNRRVQWLVANHERPDLDDGELQALIAADGASANLPAR